jgi:CAAX prenyl protease-like protein
MRISPPALVRSLPFGLFLLLLFVRQHLQGRVDGAFDLRLLYPLKTVLVGGLLVYLYREYTELRQLPRSGTWLWLWAPIVGALVFVLWVNLDQGWLNLGTGGFVYDPRDPHTGRILWGLAAFRLGGSALVVPVMEELFWRSFIMRWIDKRDFLDLSPAVVSLKAVAISCLLFGVEHNLWFAGILAGLAYAWLYRASGSLWPPIIAHGVTNLMLGVWILDTGNWAFW